MSNNVYAQMRSNPLFAELVGRRTCFAVVLSVIVLALFYGFVLLVAFKPDFIGQPVSEGSTLTVGIAAGLFIFVFFWILMAVYVRRANTEFDALTAEIVNAAKEGQ